MVLSRRFALRHRGETPRPETTTDANRRAGLGVLCRQRDFCQAALNKLRGCPGDQPSTGNKRSHFVLAERFGLKHVARAFLPATTEPRSLTTSTHLSKLWIMPSLNDQLNSFKARVRTAPVIGKRVVEQPAKQEPNLEPPAKRVRPVSYTHAGTAFVHAIEYLKKNECPILLKDLEDYLSSPVEPLIPLLQQHRNIRVNLRDRTATYVSKYDVYSADDLLSFLKRQQSFVGVPVKELKDGWSGALPTINRLEAEQKLLVMRNKKDNSPRTIWINDGGPLDRISKDFVDLWQTAKVPSTSDLPETLESVGLKPSSVDPSKVKQVKKTAPERKQKRTQRGKITNTHLRGVLKDYSQL